MILSPLNISCQNEFIRRLPGDCLKLLNLWQGKSSTLLRRLLAEGKETLSLLWMEMTHSELLKPGLPSQHNLVQWCVIITPWKLSTAPHFCDQEQDSHSLENIFESIIASPTIITIYFSQRSRIKASNLWERHSKTFKHFLLFLFHDFLMCFCYQKNICFLPCYMSEKAIDSENLNQCIRTRVKGTYNY